MAMVRAEMDILSSATADWTSWEDIKGRYLLLPLQRIPWGIINVLLPLLARRPLLSTMYLMVRAETPTSSVIMVSNATINHSTGLMSVVSEELKNKPQGWTLIRWQEKTRSARTAVIIWTGLLLKQWTCRDCKVQPKKNRLTDYLLHAWVLEEAVLAPAEFTVLTCKKPFTHLWLKVVKPMDSRPPNTSVLLNKAALLSSVITSMLW